MIVSHITLKNWRNFQSVDVDMGNRVFLVGPNASGKSQANQISLTCFAFCETSPILAVVCRKLSAIVAGYLRYAVLQHAASPMLR
jgi:predicted ATPase